MNVCEGEYLVFQDGGWHSALPGSTPRWEITLKLQIRTQAITDWLQRASHHLQPNCSKWKNTLISNTISNHPVTIAGFTPKLPSLVLLTSGFRNAPSITTANEGKKIN